MAGKGSADSRSPDRKKRREQWPECEYKGCQRMKMKGRGICKEHYEQIVNHKYGR